MQRRKKKNPCPNLKKNKHLAYGQRFSKGVWCDMCDCHFQNVISKKAARQKAKREIRVDLNMVVSLEYNL